MMIMKQISYSYPLYKKLVNNVNFSCHSIVISDYDNIAEITSYHFNKKNIAIIYQVTSTNLIPIQLLQKEEVETGQKIIITCNIEGSTQEKVIKIKNRDGLDSLIEGSSILLGKEVSAIVVSITADEICCITTSSGLIKAKDTMSFINGPIIPPYFNSEIMEVLQPDYVSLDLNQIDNKAMTKINQPILVNIESIYHISNVIKIIKEIDGFLIHFKIDSFLNDYLSSLCRFYKKKLFLIESSPFILKEDYHYSLQSSFLTNHKFIQFIKSLISTYNIESLLLEKTSLLLTMLVRHNFDYLPIIMIINKVEDQLVQNIIYCSDQEEVQSTPQYKKARVILSLFNNVDDIMIQIIQNE
jgi:hypothetical protein